LRRSKFSGTPAPPFGLQSCGCGSASSIATRLPRADERARFDTDGIGPVRTAATAKTTPRYGCRSQRCNSAARCVISV
jgi:hypothetical protein